LEALTSLAHDWPRRFFDEVTRLAKEEDDHRDVARRMPIPSSTLI